MDATNILQFLAKPNARYSRVVYCRPVKQKKTATSIVTKRVEMVCRTGVNYGNMAVNADRKGETGPLPWGRWVVVNKVIENNGKFYLRVCPESAKTVYYKDGVEVSKDEALSQALASEVSEESPVVCNIGFDNITELV